MSLHNISLTDHTKVPALISLQRKWLTNQYEKSEMQLQMCGLIK